MSKSNGKDKPVKSSKSLRKKGQILNDAYHKLRRADPELLDAVLNSSSDPRVKHLRDAVRDEQCNRLSFAQLCREADLTLEDFTELLRSYKVNESLIGIFKRLPVMTESIMDDAIPHDEICPGCGGLGQISTFRGEDGEPEPVQCDACAGRGAVRVKGDRAARDQILKAAGLAKDAPAVAIQQNFSGAPPPVEKDIEAIEEATE